MTQGPNQFFYFDDHRLPMGTSFCQRNQPNGGTRFHEEAALGTISLYLYISKHQGQCFLHLILPNFGPRLESILQISNSMSSNSSAPPSSVTISTLLPTHALASPEAAAAAAAAALTSGYAPPEGYTKWRKHKGVKLNLGRLGSPGALSSDSGGEEDGDYEFDPEEEEGRETAFRLLAFPDGSPCVVPNQRTLSASSTSSAPDSASSRADNLKTLMAYKEAAKTIIREYLVEGDLDATLGFVRMTL